MTDYQTFLDSKRLQNEAAGFKPIWLPDFLFGFQRNLVDWSVRLGKAAIFADCGLGKTPMQLAWAENVVRKTNGNVLILCPLAVSPQTVREGEKFVVAVRQTREGKVHKGINATNYERLHYFRPEDFAGVVLDECFPAKTKVQVIRLDNSLSWKYIEDIRPGDRILNASGVDRVAETKKRRVNRVAVLRIRGKEIACSENHPFLTVHGWKPAKNLQAGDHLMETETAMRLVRNRLPIEILGEKVQSFLRGILLGEMEDEYSRTQRESPQSQNLRKNRNSSEVFVQDGTGQRIGSPERCENDWASAEAGNGCEDDRYENEERDIATMEREEGWKRDRPHCPGIDLDECLGKGLEVLRCQDWQEENRTPNSLQDRRRQRKIENSHRSRWVFPSQTQGTRRQERQVPGFARVESIEVLKPDDTRLERYRNANGALYFYDLEAEQHSSFSVEGILVHNSSILKGFDRKRRKEITAFMSKIQYRLLCTATPAPNDFMELGTSSEALGQMSRNQMLAMFFTNRGDATQEWELKGHAKGRFWQWVSTWARAVRRPSDLGYDDDGFILPKLDMQQEILSSVGPKDGLFTRMARTLNEQRAERNSSVERRCGRVAEIVPKKRPCVIWCHLNRESKFISDNIPDAVEVCGSDREEVKEERLVGFSEGQIRVLVTKPRIAGLGLNWQHCSDVVYFPSHSHEQFYQAIRRCWRFGQEREVACSIVATSAEQPVIDNMLRKERQSIELYDGIVRHMNRASKQKEAEADKLMEVPAWLRNEQK